MIKEWHRPRMAKLIESGIDVLAIEIIPTLVSIHYYIIKINLQ